MSPPSLGQAHLDLHINSGQAPVSCSSGLNMPFGASGTGGAGWVRPRPPFLFHFRAILAWGEQKLPLQDSLPADRSTETPVCREGEWIRLRPDDLEPPYSLSAVSPQDLERISRTPRDYRP